MTSEVEHMIRNAKTRKPVGPDEIPTDLLKLIDEDNIKVLVNHFNIVYDTVVLPSEWLNSTFVAIPKKTQCNKILRIPITIVTKM